MIGKLDAVSELISKGQVKLGMTRHELLSLLGPPDGEGGTSRKFRIPAIYLYGDVQFVFPQATTPTESEPQGLLYVYVDDGIDDVEEPFFLLK